MFDWDENNLRKIRAHRIKPGEVEKALSSDPIPIYEQDVQGEVRYVYYCETDSGRLLAVVLVERGEQDPGCHRVRSGCRSEERLPRPAVARGVNDEKETDYDAEVRERREEADWWASRQGREF